MPFDHLWRSRCPRVVLVPTWSQHEDVAGVEGERKDQVLVLLAQILLSLLVNDIDQIPESNVYVDQV